MTELKELPPHDGAWGRNEIYDESVWSSAKEALEDCGPGSIVCVQVYTEGATLWGFETYDEEKDEYTQRWFDRAVDAERAFKDRQ